MFACRASARWQGTRGCGPEPSQGVREGALVLREPASPVSAARRAKAQAARREPRPWMAEANVRRRGTGDPEAHSRLRPGPPARQVCDVPLRGSRRAPPTLRFDPRTPGPTTPTDWQLYSEPQPNNTSATTATECFKTLAQEFINRILVVRAISGRVLHSFP